LLLAIVPLSFPVNMAPNPSQGLKLHNPYLTSVPLESVGKGVE
jgi:hypothetical protein